MDVGQYILLCQKFWDTSQMGNIAGVLISVKGPSNASAYQDNVLRSNVSNELHTIFKQCIKQFF